MNELSELFSEIKDGGKIVLEHGREYHVYVSDLPAQGNAAVELKGKKNIMIDGGGSALKIHGAVSAFAFFDCKNITVKNLTADFDAEETGKAQAIDPAPAALFENSENITFSGVRFRRFQGSGVIARGVKNMKLFKTECLLKDGDGKKCSGFFRFEDCRGTVKIDGCVVRAAGATGDFAGVRGEEKCNLEVKNSYVSDNAGRGVYYAAGGKAAIEGNTFSRTGGAALCARDCEDTGAAYVKKIVFKNNVADGCGNKYEEKYSVAYFPTSEAGCENCPGTNGKTACGGKKTVGTLVLNGNHFFNPEDEEHRIYLAGVKNAIFKNNTFDRPYKIDRENVKKLTENGDIAAEKCP